jgi:hypothetical protein
MTAADYKRLETHLNAAEAVFESEFVPGNKALELRIELRDLIAKVNAERIGTEERESVSAGNTRDTSQSIGRLIALEHIKSSTGDPFGERGR